MSSQPPSSDGGKPIHEPKHVKIICIGAGASGLLLAYKLQRSFDKFDLALYEKNADISGTWFENNYPGCACDVPAHAYTYTFEPSTSWSTVYAGSSGIKSYFVSFAKKHDLYRYISLSHQVVGATWNEQAGGWDIDVKNLTDGTIKHDFCHVLISATGIMNAWKWPEIPGLHDFKGPLLHTARWDPSVDLAGKHVGVIGNGASAIQLLPAIAPITNKITTFIRQPTWVSPFSLPMGSYTEEERQKFEADPQAHLEYRKKLETVVNGLFHIMQAGSPKQAYMVNALTQVIQGTLQNKPDFAKEMVPSWPVGCKRLTFGTGYLEALASEKVEVVFGEIGKVTAEGLISADGEERPVDVLICATGFDTSFRPRFPLLGVGGKNLANEWETEPKSYFGIATDEFPNYFMFVGPNSPYGNGAFMVALEAQADYMLKMINRWQTENIHSFVPKAEAVRDFVAYKDELMKSTVWSHDCKSWYKNGDHITGKVIALWPGSTLHYIEAMADPRYEDWEFKYNGNRFAFLGNGLSQVESDKTADWAYYLRNEDDGPHLSRLKNTRIISKTGTVVRD